MRRNQLETFDDYYYAALSKVMSELRDRCGRTYDDVALLCDLKPNTFYRYENGDRAMPITTFKRLCLIYNVDMKETLAKINDLAYKMMEGKDA